MVDNQKITKLLLLDLDVVSSFNRNHANQKIGQFTAAVKTGLGA